MASRIGVAVSGANGDRSGSAEDGAKTSAGDAGHGSKGEEKGRGVNGGRIVEQIISNLPSGIWLRKLHFVRKIYRPFVSRDIILYWSLNWQSFFSSLFTADDQAPDADEASLLIAIIED